MKTAKYPLISIVMLNYNGLNYLKRTVPALLNLKYNNYEIIVVDNGSTDGSLDFLKKVKKIRLIKSPRTGEKNYACNYAIKRTKGEYILLLDNDIIIKEKEILQNLLKGAESLDRFGAYTLAFINEGEEKTKGYGIYLDFNFTKRNRWLEKDKIKDLMNSRISSLHGIGLFLKRNLWITVEGYDEHLAFGGDDIDLGIKISLIGFKNYLYSNSVQTHIGLLERKDNKKYSTKFKKNIYGHLYTITKNYNAMNFYLIIIVYTIRTFFKSIKQSIFRLNIGPFLSFFAGYYLFIINLPYALKKRKKIQSKRVIKEDIFLKIRPPKI